MTTVLEWILYGVATLMIYLIYGISRRYVRWYFTPLWQLPGPKRGFVVGTFLEIMKSPFMREHYIWWDDAATSLGGKREDVDLIHYTGFLGTSSIVVLNADYAKQILMSNHRSDPPRYLKKFKNIEALIGRGLVTLEGPDWHRHRRIIHPSFQVGFLKTQLGANVPAKVNALVEYWKQAGSTTPIDIFAHFSNITLDILGEVAFGHTFSGMKSIEEWAARKGGGDGDSESATASVEVPPVSDRLIKAMQASMKASPKRIILSVFGLQVFDFEASKTTKTLNEAVDEVVQNAIRQKEKQASEQRSSTTAAGTTTSSSKYAAKSLLELLLDAKDTEQSSSSSNQQRALNNTELRDEVKTFLTAGHETTSTWCYWSIYVLCQHPDVQDKLYQDIVKHCPDGSEGMDLETIEQMTYFDAFLKEVLRLHSPVGMMIRHPVHEETFGDGKYKIPANTRMVIPTYLLHKSPKYWKDPETFEPERWLNMDEDGKIQPPYSHPYAYLPFSTGPRNCIGYKFATIEAKLILAPLIRKFRFELIPELRDTKFTLTSFITVKAKPTVLVNAKLRQP